MKFPDKLEYIYIIFFMLKIVGEHSFPVSAPAAWVYL